MMTQEEKKPEEDNEEGSSEEEVNSTGSEEMNKIRYQTLGYKNLT